MEDNLIFRSDLISYIKQKPELHSLDDAFVDSFLQKHLSAINIDWSKYSSFSQALRNKKVKSLISLVRKDLRTAYGLYIKTPLSLSLLDSVPSFDDEKINSLLDMHRSTSERLPFYTSIYPLLFNKLFSWGLTKKFTLLDLACGFNPLACAYLPVFPKKYFASDLSSFDMNFINVFFSKFDLSGEAVAFDALSDSFKDWLVGKSFDLVFLFKALDSFEQVERHSSKKLLSKINSKFFVVSFSLVSIGGKSRIDASKRSWFETFCTKTGWTFEVLQVPNELFYVVKTF